MLLLEVNIFRVSGVLFDNPGISTRQRAAAGKWPPQGLSVHKVPFIEAFPRYDK
jgi:hypothetical protein